MSRALDTHREREKMLRGGYGKIDELREICARTVRNFAHSPPSLKENTLPLSALLALAPAPLCIRDERFDSQLRILGERGVALRCWRK